jgi:hypothetical protein
LNDNSNDESDANDSDSDMEHDDCGNLTAWEYYTQLYDSPQMFDDSDSVGIPRAAATQQGTMPEETTVSDSTLQPEQSQSKRSRSDIECKGQRRCMHYVTSQRRTSSCIRASCVAEDCAARGLITVIVAMFPFRLADQNRCIRTGGWHEINRVATYVRKSMVSSIALS